MASSEALPNPGDLPVDHGHGGHGDHDHPAFLAHHFDTPQQQFDSGKLGMWLFLVTEVLFFSGMFCAYALFRMLRPEVFVGCSEFLNTKLGAINTGVLLFSSLTAAWAVRCSQTNEHKKLVVMLASTISCAMIFLGVKAIEYSHKWEMGLLPAGLFNYDPAHPHGVGDHPNYLLWICAPFLLTLVGCVAWLVQSFLAGNKFQFECAKPLTVAAACFFVGVGLGMVLESGGSEGLHEGDHASGGEHAAVDHGDVTLAMATPMQTSDSASTEDLVYEALATDSANLGIKSELEARRAQSAIADGKVNAEDKVPGGGIETVEKNVYTQRTAGVFFSIYYCMTGVHAIHILAGIGVLVWLLIRGVRQDFNPQYFGPVDYVGLYWHLVDLIWIYLFPLLYLIR
ncbi:MAG: cytochrome c oxidase subunit 3 [Planctomycetota bacterium]